MSEAMSEAMSEGASDATPEVPPAAPPDPHGGQGAVLPGLSGGQVAAPPGHSGGQVAVPPGASGGRGIVPPDPSGGQGATPPEPRLAEGTAPPVRRRTLTLPAGPSGTARRIEVLHFGTPGARPRAYLQAGLHADELPGMLALRELSALLAEEAAAGRIIGEVVVVPVCNPVGLAQHPGGQLSGRYETQGGENFNRGWPDPAEAVAARLDGRLGPDAAANVAAIRAALGEAAAALPERTEMEGLRKALYTLAHDADIVLDLHADNEAEVHLYIGTPLWPDAADLAAEIGARAVLLAEVSGGNPFDEAFSGPWWALAARHPGAAVPSACLACTVELRSNNTVDEGIARGDARALLRFLIRRGVVAGTPGPLPDGQAEATPLDGMQQVAAPVAGLILYRAALGARVAAGEVVAEIVDPLGGRTEVRAETAGILFARQEQRYAWAGRIIGKIAGAEPLAARVGTVLLPA